MNLVLPTFSHDLPRALADLTLPPQPPAVSRCSLQPPAPSCHPPTVVCSLPPSGDHLQYTTRTYLHILSL
ncbi:hypothetical protein BDR05DRAFT_963959 [Suillus weaverae]|nr:hypothetical protein BDR05DRAFT_963959 [Suillus weaverae]